MKELLVFSVKYCKASILSTAKLSYKVITSPNKKDHSSLP